MTYAYTLTNGRLTMPPPAKTPAVAWRKKGCRNCKPIVIPTRPTQPFTRSP